MTKQEEGQPPVFALEMDCLEMGEFVSELLLALPVDGDKLTDQIMTHSAEDLNRNMAKILAFLKQTDYPVASEVLMLMLQAKKNSNPFPIPPEWVDKFTQEEPGQNHED